MTFLVCSQIDETLHPPSRVKHFEGAGCEAASRDFARQLGKKRRKLNLPNEPHTYAIEMPDSVTTVGAEMTQNSHYLVIWYVMHVEEEKEVEVDSSTEESD